MFDLYLYHGISLSSHEYRHVGEFTLKADFLCQARPCQPVGPGASALPSPVVNPALLRSLHQSLLTVVEANLRSIGGWWFEVLVPELRDNNAIITSF